MTTTTTTYSANVGDLVVYIYQRNQSHTVMSSLPVWFPITDLSNILQNSYKYDFKKHTQPLTQICPARES